MTCSGVRQRPTVRDAQPGIIDAALNRSRPVASGNWFAFAASDHIRADRPFGTSVGGTEIVTWRDSGHRVACRPGVRPHLGADLSTGTVDCGTLMSVARIAVGGRLGIRVDTPARSRRRCTGVGAAGHRGRRSTAGFSGCSGPAHRQRLHAVTRPVGVCEPDDIIANRLDPWHGAGFHPYSFMHLDVLAWAFGP